MPPSGCFQKRARASQEKLDMNMSRLFSLFQRLKMIRVRNHSGLSLWKLDYFLYSFPFRGNQ